MSYAEYYQKWEEWFIATQPELGPKSWITVNKWRNAFKENEVKHLYARTRRLRAKVKKGNGVTKYGLFLKFGKDEGAKRWKSYCDKQAYTNSKEYKGMTDAEFLEYNKSRACTIENLIRRHGKEKGMEKWKHYCEKQKYTKSKQRYIDEFGEEEGLKIANEINATKATTVQNFIKKYGEEEGVRRYTEMLTKKSEQTFYSTEATAFFDKIAMQLPYTCFYRPHYKEMVLWSKEANSAFFYDFYCKDLGVVVEYNGSVFHANPNLYAGNDFPNPYIKDLKAEDIWKRDELKRNLALSKGFRYIVIWDTYAKENTCADREVCDIMQNSKEQFVELL